jgi:undecaprenyl-phosphate 4-deoxy-4-formamido-L-arabinose transferase
MPNTPDAGSVQPHEVSVVIPVYKGETTLPGLLAELESLTAIMCSPGGSPWRVSEVILVHDNGPDGSADVMRAAVRDRPHLVRTVWLSGNFGQHSATLAGIASSGSEWIATIDEDGQHNPAEIGLLIDAALTHQAPLVYARPINPPPHGPVRNLASRTAKRIVALLTGSHKPTEFHSYRLLLGDVGRSVAAYAGSGVYLDIALGWVVSSTATAGVTLREEGGRPSGYTTLALVRHFWHMVLSAGTRALRIVSVTGALFALLGLILTTFFVIQYFAGGDLPAGWTSLITVSLVGSGLTLFALGVTAEYIGLIAKSSLGKPAYLIVNDRDNGPLGRTPRQ